jgi:hypothetical protein
MAPKRIVFSPHALERMKERRISKEMVRKAINAPDRVERSSFRPPRFLVKKLYFNKKLKKEHLLLIILEIKQNIIEVITIIDTSKISKYF